jgi:hypothetical protein
VLGVLHQAGRDRLDALALSIEQQAGDVLPHGRPALGSSQPHRQRLDERRQFTIQAFQCVWRHTRNRSRVDRRVKM